MMSLNYYLRKSAHGDSVAAYEAAKIMQLEKYSEVTIQAQLRKAASLGSVDAMRWLGFLGLSGNLISPESTITKVSYYTTFDKAYLWFAQGARKGDPLCLFVVALCLQHGIGTEADPERSEKIMATVSNDISVDMVIPIIFLINSLHSSLSSSHKELSDDFIEKLLCG